VDTSLPGARVVRVLEKLAFTRGLPQVIVSDNGSEFTGRTLEDWTNRHGVRLHFIYPGSPMQNVFVESFNGKFREECLDLYWFKTIEKAKEKIEAWRVYYNEHRPHSELNDQTPSEFAEIFDLSWAVEKTGF
jgi:putative transposase